MTLGTIKTLTDLTFSPNSYKIAYENSSIDPLAESLQYLNTSSIKRLHLQTYKNIIGKHVVEISQALKKFNSLQVLCLDLTNSQDLTDESLMQISSILNGLASLVSLSLSFSVLTQNFAPALKSLRNLAHLKLSFQTPILSSNQLQQLSSSLKALKSSLKFLEIRFSEKSSLSDSMIENLADALKELGLLKHLSLRFTLAPNFTTTLRGVKALSFAIQELSNLSSLKLNLANSKGIDKTAVIFLSQALQRLPSLYSIDLDLAQCDEVRFGGKSLEGFLSSLCTMKNVGELRLKFPPCSDQIQEVKKFAQKLNIRISELLDTLEIFTVS